MGVSKDYKPRLLERDSTCQYPSCPLNIWSIDDDEIFQFTLKEELQLLNIRKIKTFEHGREALEALAQYAQTPDSLPDVIFLNSSVLGMESEQFLELYEHLFDQCLKDIRLIVLSEEEPQLLTGHLLVEQWLPKPIPFSQLKAVMAESLREFARRLVS